MLDIDALNKFSDAADDVKVCWMMAANANNTDTLKYRFHTHNFYEIHFVLSGHIIYGFEDKTVLVKCGEFIQCINIKHIFLQMLFLLLFHLTQK